MNSDGELLAAVLATPGFLESFFHADQLSDWGLARRLGEFLVRIEPDSEIMGHALQVRACRHLGDLEHARRELTACADRLAQRELEPWELTLLKPMLDREEKLLSS